MARELSTFLLLTNAGGTVQLWNIWKSIRRAKKILEFIGKLPEWINYNKNLEEHLQRLRMKLDCLESVQTDVQTLLENTEIQNGKKRKRVVDHWLRSVKRKDEDVEKVENDINSVSYFPRFLFRAWLGSRIGKEIQEVNELLEEGKFPEGPFLDATQDGEPLVSTELVGHQIDEIWAHVVNPNTIRIGVQGPEGIGKSAIMIQVYNRLCSFYRVYYVSVPENFSTYHLQDAIAKEMKVKLPERSELKRASRIHRELESIKEFVLILDGLSCYFSLEKVGIPMQGNGGKLILTSRELRVCREMSCQETVLLETLSEDDSEKLFDEKLAATSPLSQEIRDVRKEILAKCDGIPSRIITIANRLRGVFDINEWRCTLNEM